METSLRDQIAMAALTGFCAAPDVGIDPPITAKFCYEIADAFLAERDKKAQVE